jgi:hypothetical protein
MNFQDQKSTKAKQHTANGEGALFSNPHGQSQKIASSWVSEPKLLTTTPS